MMKEQLAKIRSEALAAFAGAGSAQDLDALRVKYLGKKGELTAVLKQMGKLSAEERPVIGQLPMRSAPPLRWPCRSRASAWRPRPWRSG